MLLICCESNIKNTYKHTQRVNIINKKKTLNLIIKIKPISLKEEKTNLGRTFTTIEKKKMMIKHKKNEKEENTKTFKNLKIKANKKEHTHTQFQISNN